jgi:HEAT repeat protein
MAVSQSVYAIGCLKSERHKQDLIELLLQSVNNDMISEAICAAIVEYDKSILPDVIKAFHAAESQETKEHLLTCVAEISRENRSDEVFYFLKNAFRVLTNLRLAAEVLGDYGDGRAIPLLRGYILKNIKEMDKTTFNHLRAVIKKLGGEIDDLKLAN